MIEGCDLRRATTVTCGCHFGYSSGHKNKTHGGTYTPEYISWIGLNRRCLVKSCKSYKNYGGRGISVDSKWSQHNSEGFNNFLADMGIMPAKGYSIERVDVNKGYTKSNCIWIKKELQAKNTRSVKKLNYKGKILNQNEWANILGVYGGRIQYLLKSGRNFEDVVDYICSCEKDSKEKLILFMGNIK